MSRYPHLGAFESTKIHGTGQDVLGTTKHIDRWRDDLEMLASVGIRELRYPVPWHRVQARPEAWDWTWLDGPVHLMRELGMSPILDPLHHVSIPDWLEGGFAHPEFPALYTRFITAVAQRYPWVDRYTVLNEPLPTTILCGCMGVWYPYGKSDRDFVSIATNVARTICTAGAELRKLNPHIKLVHIDSCEHHTALDSKAEQFVDHANARRFLYHDLTLGRVDDEHRLLRYLKKHGFSQDDQSWFQDHPSTFDVLGLDYYAHAEMNWFWNAAEEKVALHFPCETPRGFAKVAGDYVERYQTPIMLSETNVGGTPADRITWLKFMEEEAERLSAAADFRGFCWFPSIDATDWCSLCTKAQLIVSPMGIWGLDEERYERHRTELADWYVRLAQGRATWRDLPAYRFTPPLDKDLRGYVKLMSHWENWLEQAPYSAYGQ